MKTEMGRIAARTVLRAEYTDSNGRLWIVEKMTMQAHVVSFARVGDPRCQSAVALEFKSRCKPKYGEQPGFVNYSELELTVIEEIPAKWTPANRPGGQK